MCSSNVSDPANRLRKTRKSNPTAASFSCLRSLPSAPKLSQQGKGRSSKRKENRRCPFLFAHRRGYGVVPAVRRRRIPSLRFSEKLPARKGRTRLRQFECPAGSVQKRSRPLGANTLTQFASPAQPVQKRSRPVRAEPACGSSYAPVNQCRKAPSSTAIKIFKKICVTLLQNTRK